MSVALPYHVGGKFEGNRTKFHYEGGEVVTISDIEPNMINAFDLEAAISSEARRQENSLFYYKKQHEKGVDSFWVIANDQHIRELHEEYCGREVYDIYVESEVDVKDGKSRKCSDNENEYYESDDDCSEFEEIDFEVGDWLSEDDVDEAKEVRQKVHEAKKKLKSGVPFLCNYNGDGYESDRLEEEDIGYYEETDLDDETTYHDVRRQSPYPRTEILFNRHKEQLCKENVAACEAMVKINLKHWSCAYFSTLVKCDSVDNNLSESFNALILEASHKLVFSMLEDIRTMCIEQIAVKRALAKKMEIKFLPKDFMKSSGSCEGSTILSYHLKREGGI
ncbi:hypothetical protein LINPERPRIM_LOCUS24868 [Linum perenne]